MHRFTIIKEGRLSKVQQIVETIRRDIEKGLLNKNDKLPSINEFSDQYNVARDTVEKAYKELKKQGFILSFAAKGYFVQGRKDTRLKVLLVFNKLSSFKKLLYDSFIKTVGENVKVDLQIHHYNPRFLRDIIEANLGLYHYYVVMPHFFYDASMKECRQILELVPDNQLVILDKRMPGLKKQSIEVYQDFEMDIFNALTEGSHLMNKYNHLALIIEAGSNHPKEIIEGARKYAAAHAKGFSVEEDARNMEVMPEVLYIITGENDLAVVVKKTRLAGWQLGKDVGIISFNETVLKELLDIAVITTDFEAMGRTAAQCLLNNEVKQIKNPFYFIERKSV